MLIDEMANSTLLAHMKKEEVGHYLTNTSIVLPFQNLPRYCIHALYLIWNASEF